MQPEIPEKPFLKASEVARIFNVNHSTVFLWVKKGIIRPHKTLGGNFRFAREHIVRLWGKKGQSKNPKARPKGGRNKKEMYVSIKLDDDTDITYHSAKITDLSSHGVALVIDDSNGLTDRFSNNEVKEVTVMNYLNPLFKEKLSGTVNHYQVTEDGNVAVGINFR
ncbi:MAG: MerR family transcriptional regulator [Chitinivibrionales bacterium]|nr:MerR family transcriptional regulator [Chitinivibrionales bacterium]